MRNDDTDQKEKNWFKRAIPKSCIDCFETADRVTRERMALLSQFFPLFSSSLTEVFFTVLVLAPKSHSFQHTVGWKSETLNTIFFTNLFKPLSIYWATLIYLLWLLRLIAIKPYLKMITNRSCRLQNPSLFHSRCQFILHLIRPQQFKRSHALFTQPA